MKTIDIYIKSTDNSFKPDRDIDREHLRELMSKQSLTQSEYDQYGLYCSSVARILLSRSEFRNYPDDVKEEMRGEALIDTLKARQKFNADKYKQLSAAFSYLYRISYHSFQHVLKKYYRSKQNLILAASRVDNAENRIFEGECFDPELIQSYLVDWDKISAMLD